MHVASFIQADEVIKLLASYLLHIHIYMYYGVRLYALALPYYVSVKW